MNKVLAFEKNVFFKNKPLVALIITCVIIFLIVFFLFCFYDFDPTLKIDRTNILEEYNEKIVDLNNKIQELEMDDTYYPSDLKQILLSDYRLQIKYYSYLINNNYIEEDFYKIGGMSKAEIILKEGHQGTAFMFYVTKNSTIFLYVFVILTAIYSFVAKYKGEIKLLIEKISKKNIFDGEYTFALLSITVAHFSFFIIGLVGGLIDKSDMVLIYNDKTLSFYVLNTISIYLWYQFGRFILMLFLLNFTIYLGEKLKSIRWTIIYEGIVLLIFLLVGYFSSGMFLKNANYSYLDVGAILPIISIETNFSMVTQYSAISICYHFVIAELLVLIARHNFIRGEIV